MRRLLGRAVGRASRAVFSRISTSDAPINEDAKVVFRDTEGVILGSSTSCAGKTLLSIARENGIELDHFCGGQCSCGTCRGKVTNGEGNLSKPSGPEQMVLGPKHLSSCGRLACQARVTGDVEVEVPSWF